MVFGCHLEILNNFVFNLCFKVKSSGTMGHELGTQSLSPHVVPPLVTSCLPRMDSLLLPGTRASTSLSPPSDHRGSSPMGTWACVGRLASGFLRAWWQLSPSRGSHTTELSEGDSGNLGSHPSKPWVGRSPAGSPGS